MNILQDLICDFHAVVRSLKIASTQNTFVQNFNYTNEITKKYHYFTVSIISNTNKKMSKTCYGNKQPLYI